MTLKNFYRWMETSAQVVTGGTALMALCMAVAGGDAKDTRAGYRDAMMVYQAQQWPQAYKALAALADSGNPAAARVAAMMARQGPRLFGQAFTADAEQIARWELALQEGGEAPPRQHFALNLSYGPSLPAVAELQIAHAK